MALAAVAFVLFVFPRFTNVGGKLCLLILLLVIIDVVLVLRDLFRSGTRGRAIVAVLLWLPILFLFAMMMQWEGPLYVAARGDPPVFQARGLAGLCGVDIYDTERQRAEWPGDDIDLLWSISHTVRFPFEAKFKYGEVPSGFAQVTPSDSISPPPLSPNVTYELVLGRCMGGPQYLSLHGGSISEYKPNPNVCWGELKIPERQNSITVRVDCKTRQPFPMSKRAVERLKAYRENRIAFY
jgi:hypothetical protein